MKSVAIVAGKSSYRTPDFLEAASLLRLEVIIVGDGEAPARTNQIEVSLDDPVAAAKTIVVKLPRVDAIIGVDDSSVLTAARAAADLGLHHNPVEAVAATRDKAKLRQLLDSAGVAQPDYRLAPPGAVGHAAGEVGYPVVVKPTGLSASRGVIRVDDPSGASATENRIRNILTSAGLPAGQSLLVERYIPGAEIAVEGLISQDGLEVLAIIDKPDPLEGPFFEETLYVTPSRHDPIVQQRATELMESVVDAIGLTTGPVHGEIRITPEGECYLIEIAARSIGGLCGRALTFGLLGESLEVAILRSALGIRSPDLSAARLASGVLMLPIPATGTLTGIAGLSEARQVEGIDNITITVPIGRSVAALPEGDRYLGFVFASGSDATTVETSLRRAGNELSIMIDGEEIDPPIPL